VHLGVIIRFYNPACLTVKTRKTVRMTLAINICVYFTACLLFFLAPTNVSYAENVKPFWTEKSSYIEGDNLYVVGVASNATSIEAGRKRAFENGKSEIMNFTQISDLEGLVITTQMTYEEKTGNNYNVYRLMYVGYEDINSLKSKNFEQTKKNYDRYQKKQEQEIIYKKKALSKLSRNKQELAQLDKEYYKFAGNYHIASEKALRYVKVGMSRSEIESLLGSPRSIQKHYYDYVYDLKYGKYWVIFNNADTVDCLSTTTSCVRDTCNNYNTKCTRGTDVSYYNRMLELE